jgi:hypothetical protein
MKRFSYPSHVRKDRLAEVPAEERVGRATRVVQQATVKALPSQMLSSREEEDNLVPILKYTKLVSI